MSEKRATWTRKTAEPTPGTTGTVLPALGHSTPHSVEHGAYLFIPDGQEDAFYCSDQDLCFV